MKIQLNHPGPQKHFKIGKGYINIGNSVIVREWNGFVRNNDKGHYRKFIQNQGYYVNGLNDSTPIKEDLYFWGEWEGNSFFQRFLPKPNDHRIMPNGIHKPFHSIAIRGNQNTDPYIFGDDFKYCVCKQKGQLCNLVIDDLILFGSVYPQLGKFYIDTVFVVKSNMLSTNIQATGGAGYSQVYREETLEQLVEYLHPITRTVNNNKIYNSKTWWDDKDYFSFVPCKLSPKNNGFERLYIELNNPKFNLLTNPTGKSFLERCNLTSQDLWKEIVQLCIEQKFNLGVRFDEPIFNNCLQNVIEENGSY